MWCVTSLSQQFTKVITIICDTYVIPYVLYCDHTYGTVEEKLLATTHVPQLWKLRELYVHV